MPNIYLRQEGKVLGPFTADEYKYYSDSGLITANAMMRYEEDSFWHSAIDYSAKILVHKNDRVAGPFPPQELAQLLDKGLVSFEDTASFEGSNQTCSIKDIFAVKAAPSNPADPKMLDAVEGGFMGSVPEKPLQRQKKQTYAILATAFVAISLIALFTLSKPNNNPSNVPEINRETQKSLLKEAKLKSSVNIEVLEYNRTDNAGPLEVSGIFFKDGKPYSGHVFESFPNGILISEGIMEEGKFHGPFAEYYDNGRLKESGHYVRGLREGTYERYSQKDALLIVKCRFKNDKEDGQHFKWAENGNLIFKGSAKNGVLDGISMYWRDDGTPKEEITWKENKPIYKKVWDESGNLLREFENPDVYDRWAGGGAKTKSSLVKNISVLKQINYALSTFIEENNGVMNGEQARKWMEFIKPNMGSEPERWMGALIKKKDQMSCAYSLNSRLTDTNIFKLGEKRVTIFMSNLGRNSQGTVDHLIFHKWDGEFISLVSFTDGSVEVIRPGQEKGLPW